jgi:hypothetical protein
VRPPLPVSSKENKRSLDPVLLAWFQPWVRFENLHPSGQLGYVARESVAHKVIAHSRMDKRMEAQAKMLEGSFSRWWVIDRG